MRPEACVELASMADVGGVRQLGAAQRRSGALRGCLWGGPPSIPAPPCPARCYRRCSPRTRTHACTAAPSARRQARQRCKVPFAFAEPVVPASESQQGVVVPAMQAPFHATGHKRSHPSLPSTLAAARVTCGATSPTRGKLNDPPHRAPLPAEWSTTFISASLSQMKPRSPPGHCERRAWDMAAALHANRCWPCCCRRPQTALTTPPVT